MKFYQIILPIILCIMYSTTIFGAEKPPDQSLYKETASLKLYPSFIRQMLSSHYLLEQFPNLEIISPKPKLLVLGYFSSVAYFFWATRTHYSIKDFFDKQWKLYGAGLYKEMLSALPSSKKVLIKLVGALLTTGLVMANMTKRGRNWYDQIITKFFAKSYTFIESPLIQDIETKKSLFIVNSKPILHIPGYKKYYRMEERSLPYLEFLGKELVQLHPQLLKKGKYYNTQEKTRNHWTYELKNGKVNIYSRGRTSGIRDHLEGSIATKEEIKVFDVSANRKTVVTGGKITRTWTLQHQE